MTVRSLPRLQVANKCAHQSALGSTFASRHRSNCQHLAPELYSGVDGVTMRCIHTLAKWNHNGANEKKLEKVKRRA